MVEQNGKVSGGKPPISKHPLFPAIVALWFGALFGLGSLAVRPTLFESIVISSGLDTLVPAAAPPLGLTARVLIAVVLAAIGGVFGALLGRRIGRDKPVERTRRRGAEQADRSAGADSVEPAAREGGGLRRRALAMSEEDNQFAVYEAAPLPGGSPGILDVTAVDIDAPAISSAPAPAPVEATLAPAFAPAPMELTEVVAEAATTTSATSFAPLPELPVTESEAASLAGARAFDRPPVAAEPAAFAPPAIEQDAFVPAAPQPFQPAPITLEQFAPEPGPRFAPPQPAATDLPLPATPAANSPLVLETAKPIDFSQPAFQPGAEVPVQAAESDEQPAARSDFAAAFEAVAARQPSVEPVAELSPVQSPVQVVEPVPAPAPFPTVLGEGDIRRIVDADLDTLSPVELVERLAMSIQQRRKARLAASTAVVAPLAAPAFVAEPVEVEAASPAPVAPVPAAYALPSEYTPPSEPEAVPAAAIPAAEVPAAAPFVPAALRPLSLDLVDDADDLDFAAIPPRHIAMAPAQPLFGGQAEPTSRLFDGAQPKSGDSHDTSVAQFDASDASETDEGEAMPEEAYSSLLDLGRPADPRPGFIRIDEPEAACAAPEPVVIFPGQAAQPVPVVSTMAPAVPSAVATAPFGTSIAAAPAGVDNGARRFDAPGLSTGAPTSFAAPPPVQQDPAETEQALRNALANLQRMSGAA